MDRAAAALWNTLTNSFRMRYCNHLTIFTSVSEQFPFTSRAHTNIQKNRLCYCIKSFLHVYLKYMYMLTA